MITAKEALALATRDEIAVENLLKQLDPLIRADYDGSGPMCCNLAITINW